MKIVIIEETFLKAETLSLNKISIDNVHLNYIWKTQLSHFTNTEIHFLREEFIIHTYGE